MSSQSNWTLSKRPYIPGIEIHAPGFVEAICKHGVGHHKGVHGCDGCCVDCPEEIWSQVTEEVRDE